MNPLAALISGQTGTPATGVSVAQGVGSLETSLFAQLLGAGTETDQPLVNGLLTDPQTILSALPELTGQTDILQTTEGSSLLLPDTTIVDPDLALTQQGTETVDVALANAVSDPEIAEITLPAEATVLTDDADPAGETTSLPAIPAVPAEAAAPAEPSERGGPAVPAVPATPAVPALSARPTAAEGKRNPETGQPHGVNRIPEEAGNRSTPNTAAAAANTAPVSPQHGTESAPQQPAATPAARSGGKPQQGGDTSNQTGRPEMAPSSGAAADQRDSVRPTALPPQPAVAATILNSVPGQAFLSGQEQPDTGIASPAAIEAATTGIQVRAALPMHAAQAPQVPVNSLAVHIARQAQNGMKQFNIRLDPPELGRLEIRLDLTREGQVTTHLVVERAETLDLLQRDARTLERALQNAGLDTSEGGLKFSLKDQGLAQDTPQDGNHTDTHSAVRDELDDISAESDNAARIAANYIATGGLDIRI